ncbi:hypothetical protein LXL04_034790 [Taraxacum kok-saghyz]
MPLVFNPFSIPRTTAIDDYKEQPSPVLLPKKLDHQPYFPIPVPILRKVPKMPLGLLHFGAVPKQQTFPRERTKLPLKHQPQKAVPTAAGGIRV